jgi:hypothetical protein
MPMRKTLQIVAFSMVLAGIAWGYTQKSTAAGTMTAQDYVDIQQLYARFYQALDSGDSETWADTFTTDGVWNSTTRGHDALVESNKRGGQNKPLRHSNSNLIITPTADGATGKIYVFQTNITTKPPSIATYSRYDDTLVKTSKGWRFKTRQRSSDTTIGK